MGKIGILHGYTHRFTETFWLYLSNLLIAKLNAYRFDQNALKFIYDHLTDRSQKTKVGSSLSAY